MVERPSDWIEDSSPGSVLRPRLAWTPESEVPSEASLSALGLEAAKDAAFAWQQQRSLAWWHEFAWITEDASRSAWVREIHGLFGMVGELALAAVEAEVEKVLLRRAHQENAVSAPLQAGLSRALRFFAEGQANYLIVAGHGLANLTVRTMALHPGFDPKAVAARTPLDATAFQPTTTDRAAWLSLNTSTAETLHAVAEDLGSPLLADVTDQLLELEANDRWRELQTLRNEQYHRWRGESPGVTGINFSDDSMIDRLRRGESVGFGRELLPEYGEGQAMLDEVVTVSRAGLDALVEWMPEYLSIWQSYFHGLRDE